MSLLAAMDDAIKESEARIEKEKDTISKSPSSIPVLPTPSVEINGVEVKSIEKENPPIEIAKSTTIPPLPLAEESKPVIVVGSMKGYRMEEESDEEEDDEEAKVELGEGSEKKVKAEEISISFDNGPKASILKKAPEKEKEKEEEDEGERGKDKVLDSDDFWGKTITYKKKDLGYKLPEGPAFADEKEFANQLSITTDKSLSKVVAGDVEEDEFAFDDKEVVSSADIVAQAKELKAKLQAKEEEEAKRILAQMKKESISTSNQIKESSPKEVKVEEQNVLKNLTSNALKDIVNKYSQEDAEEEVEEKKDDKKEVEEKKEKEKATIGLREAVIIEEEEDEEEAEEKLIQEENLATMKARAEMEAKAKEIEEKMKVKEKNLEEWDVVTADKDAQAKKEDGKKGQIVEKVIEKGTIVTYKEAWQWFTSLDKSMFLSKIIPEEFPPQSCCMNKVVRLKNEQLMKERDNVFLIAKIDLNQGELMHSRVMQTVYKNISGDKMNCPSSSDRWCIIGFQGSDPGRDLRDAGMLGILQMLYFVEHYFDLLQKIYKISLDDTQKFPLMATSLNFTLMSIRMLRNGKLINYINKTNASLDIAVTELYMAAFFELYSKWVNNGYTIRNFGTVLEEVAQSALTSCDKLIDKFKAYTMRNNFKNEDERKGKDGFTNMDI